MPIVYKLVYLPTAQKDISEAVLYIADQLKAPKAAMDLLDALDKSISRLQDFPYSYKLYQLKEALENEYRFLPVKNYGVFYVVKEEQKAIEVHRVLYGKMDFTGTIK